MTYVLIHTDGRSVIGTGPATRRCPNGCTSGRARGAVWLHNLASPEWEALTFPSPEQARAYLTNRSPYYPDYRPAPLSALVAEAPE